MTHAARSAASASLLVTLATLAGGSHAPGMAGATAGPAARPAGPNPLASRHAAAARALPGPRDPLRAPPPFAAAAGAPAPAFRPGAARRAADTRPLQSAVPYNGKFTFTRIRYGSYGGFRRGGSAWAHDYPDGDLNLQLILSELTGLRPSLGQSNVLDLENPEIFRNPILYLSEPGFWNVTEEGARNLREHLLKGGLIIFDDFETPYWPNLVRQMQYVLPDFNWIEVDGTHPIFSSFFHIDDIYVPHPFDLTRPTYYCMFEDDDPNKRPLVIANLNGDLAEYWEYSGTGWFPVDPTNDAYKIGVNYIIYAMTH